MLIFDDFRRLTRQKDTYIVMLTRGLKTNERSK